jgi:hypothetical protein
MTNLSELQESDDRERKRAVEISVNRQPVKLLERKFTGLEIKQEAISQGVSIQLDFQLSEEFPHRKTKIIGDDDVIKIKAGLTFVAVAGDDNS